MAVITALGSAGFGTSLGWLLGMLEGNLCQRFRTVAGLVGAMGLGAAEVNLLADASQLLVFAPAALMGWLLHIALRRNLRRHVLQD
jgi:hypothetical protein